MQRLFEWVAIFRAPQTAEEWVARSQSRRLSAEDARRLSEWLSNNVNRLEFDRVRAIAKWGGYLRSRPDVIATMSVYPALRECCNAESRGAVKPNASAKQWPKLAVVAACAAIIGLGTALFIPHLANSPAAGSVATARGEQRTIRLEDGSQVVVNTDSAIRVDFSSRDRRVLLPRGEAYFEVVKDPAGRAFVVQTGNTEVRVLGTKFSVRAIGSRTDVIVAEGKVEVVPDALRSSPSAPARVELIPGNALRIDRDESQVRIAAVDPERATAWRSGILFFDDLPLVDVVAELNRYSAKPYAIADERIKDIRMSGAFKIGDADAVQFALKHGFGISAENEDGRIVLR